MALALAQTLSYMSFMPEEYMGLNSFGIGFSGLFSLAVNVVLLYSFGDDDADVEDENREFVRVVTYYSIGFI